MKKPIGYDKRPRFGWSDDLDNDPQYIHEKKTARWKHPVVVIPLPYISPKLRKNVRDFAKKVWPSP